MRRSNITKAEQRLHLSLAPYFDDNDLTTVANVLKEALTATFTVRVRGKPGDPITYKEVPDHVVRIAAVREIGNLALTKPAQKVDVDMGVPDPTPAIMAAMKPDDWQRFAEIAAEYAKGAQPKQVTEVEAKQLPAG